MLIRGEAPHGQCTRISYPESYPDLTGSCNREEISSSSHDTPRSKRMKHVTDIFLFDRRHTSLAHLMTLSREGFDVFSAGSCIDWSSSRNRQWNYPNGRLWNQSGRFVEDRLGLLVQGPIRLFLQLSSGHIHENLSYDGKRNMALRWKLVFHAQKWNCICVLRGSGSKWMNQNFYPDRRMSPIFLLQELEGPKIFYPWSQIMLFWESWNAL